MFIHLYIALLSVYNLHCEHFAFLAQFFSLPMHAKMRVRNFLAHRNQNKIFISQPARQTTNIDYAIKYKPLSKTHLLWEANQSAKEQRYLHH